jgi:phytoene synthase
MVSQAISLPIPEAEDPKRYVAEVTRASGSSFFLPMMLLPREKREAMLALYAFCRETDDVADEIEDPDVSRALLDAWRNEIHALYRGAPSHPVTLALAGPVERFGLAERYFLEILEGFEMDGGGEMLRPTVAELERYCYCVASCVGLLSVEIFEYRATSIPTFARRLGLAFQLTNILRDVAEDAERGRIYLPRELLEQEGLGDVGPDAIVHAPGVDRVCREIGRMARGHFDAASEALPRSERRAMRPALLMRGVYETYLDRIEATGFRVDGPRIKFSGGAKLLLVGRGLLRTL